MKADYNIDNNSVVFYNKKHRIAISGGSSYILINDEILHLFNHVIYTNNDYLIPALSFIRYIGDYRIIDNITLDSTNKMIFISHPDYNINDYVISHKGNGYSIVINTTHTFDGNLLEYTRSGNNWLSITVPLGVIDSLNIHSIKTVDPIIDFKTKQMENVAQISFLLNVIPDKVILNSNNKKITMDIFVSKEEAAQKIKQEKYKIDTIVLDAGHGGKDPGACVKNCKVKEKDITLMLTKKIGRILSDKYNFNVIYTRQDDRFITLKDRTKIANDNNAKLFISIHANSISTSPSTKGFETYYLKIEKTNTAIGEVEKRENNVIEEFESDKEHYEGLSKIEASFIHNKNSKGSRALAELIQKELESKFNKKLNRGVKQAGFQVLWGATMPNVLIEVGFITNNEEMNNLLSSKYQHKMAEGIASAILQYKQKYENDEF